MWLLLPVTLKVEALHALFRTYSPACPPFQDGMKCWDRRRDAWRGFILKGYSDEDLLMVLKFLKVQVDRSNWNVAVMSFRNVAERLDVFQERLELAAIHHGRYVRKVPPSESVLAEFRKTPVKVDGEAKVVTPKHVLKAAMPRLFDGMRKAANDQ